MGDRCESINPLNLLGSNVQCDLAVGHKGEHIAKRERDGWVSTAYWAQDPVDDELRLLRKLASAAASYFPVSSTTKDMYWNQRLTLHNALADYRNFKAKPKVEPKKRRAQHKGQRE